VVIALLVGFMNAALAPAAIRLVTWVFKTGVADRSYAT
jgi:hypothetical protein